MPDTTDPARPEPESASAADPSLPAAGHGDPEPRPGLTAGSERTDDDPIPTHAADHGTARPDGTRAGRPGAASAEAPDAARTDGFGGSPADAPAPATAGERNDAGADKGGPPGSAARRLGQSLRDMVWSLVALLLIIAALLVFNRGCSFSPGGPTIDPQTRPTVDLSEVFPGSARTVGFPLRLPEVPDGWVANSSSTSPVPPVDVVVRAGWLTPQRFVQLSQSGAAAADLLRVETDRDAAPPTGEVVVGGTEWTVYPGRRDEAAWLADLGPVRLLITGTGTEEEFRTLAEAAQRAAPLPKQ